MRREIINLEQIKEVKQIRKEDLTTERTVEFSLEGTSMSKLSFTNYLSCHKISPQTYICEPNTTSEFKLEQMRLPLKKSNYIVHNTSNPDQKTNIVTEPQFQTKNDNINISQSQIVGCKTHRLIGAYKSQALDPRVDEQEGV